MRVPPWRHWLLTALGSVLAFGCEKAVVKPNYPPDPVLVSKVPVEGRPSSESVPVVAYHEPVMPAPPQSMLASAPDSLSVVARTTSAKPLSPPTPPAIISPPTGPNRPVSGTHGHAADYTWLQGTLDRHYLGHFNLRYCDAAKDDEWGGKVCFADDPRLQQFNNGDVLFVEGELVKENGQLKNGRLSHFPIYRIRSVEKVSAPQ